uniref:Uncharacterized protein n=1 Tax=Strongyloides stercoralis TaxID=6248 RepID=A0A0K0EFF4_STRER
MLEIVFLLINFILFIHTCNSKANKIDGKKTIGSLEYDGNKWRGKYLQPSKLSAPDENEKHSMSKKACLFKSKSIANRRKCVSNEVSSETELANSQSKSMKKKKSNNTLSKKKVHPVSIVEYINDPKIVSNRSVKIVSPGNNVKNASGSRKQVPKKLDKLVELPLKNF